MGLERALGARFLVVLIGVVGLLACGRQGFYETPCQDVTCSGHGTCVVLDDAPRCLCDRGYHEVGLGCEPVQDP